MGRLLEGSRVFAPGTSAKLAQLYGNLTCLAYLWCDLPMRSWRPVLRNRSRWLLVFLLALCGMPAVGAASRRRAALAALAALAERPLPRAKSSAVRDCEVWPPKSFPSVADVYALKLEYDCRNRAIAHQRYDLASQEARQSTALAEKGDRLAIDEKNRWAEKEQSDIESRQRELNEWRDEVFKKLQAVGQEADAERSPTEAGVLSVKQ